MGQIGSIVYGSARAAAGGGGGNLPGVTVPMVSFVVGDGQQGSPVDLQTSLNEATIQGQSVVNKQLLVIREGIELRYSTPLVGKDIRRLNSGVAGGFAFEPASGLFFSAGETYNVFIMGINNTNQI